MDGWVWNSGTSEVMWLKHQQSVITMVDDPSSKVVCLEGDMHCSQRGGKLQIQWPSLGKNGRERWVGGMNWS